MNYLNREYEDKCLNSEEEIKEFLRRCQNEKMILLKGPWFVKESSTHCFKDVSMRLYGKVGANNGVRVAYSPSFEGEWIE